MVLAKQNTNCVAVVGVAIVEVGVVVVVVIVGVVVLVLVGVVVVVVAVVERVVIRGLQSLCKLGCRAFLICILLSLDFV